MTAIANEPRNVKHVDSLIPTQSNYPFDSAVTEGQGRLDLLKERWSEFSSLLTLDFWADFLLIYAYLTAGVGWVSGMVFGMNR